MWLVQKTKLVYFKNVTLVLFKITSYTIFLIDMCIQIKIKNKVHKYETETVYANVIL